jgi:hypothetical protein
MTNTRIENWIVEKDQTYIQDKISSNVIKVQFQICKINQRIFLYPISIESSKELNKY